MSGEPFDPVRAALRARALLHKQVVAFLVHKPLLLYFREELAGRDGKRSDRRRQLVEDTVILFQLLRYRQETAEQKLGGWFPLRVEEIGEATPLTTHREQEARRILLEAGLLETRRKNGQDRGTPLEWRLTPRAFEWIDAALEKHGKPPEEGAAESESNPGRSESNSEQSESNLPPSESNSGRSESNSAPPSCSNSRGLRGSRCTEDTQSATPGDAPEAGNGKEAGAGVCVSAAHKETPSLREALMGACAVGEVSLQSRNVRRDLERVEGEFRLAGIETADRVKLWLHWFKTVDWKDDKSRPDPPKLRHFTPERLDRFLAWEAKRAARRKPAGPKAPPMTEEDRRQAREEREKVTAALREGSLIKPLDPPANGHAANGNGHKPGPNGAGKPVKAHAGERMTHEEMKNYLRRMDAGGKGVPP